MTLALCQEAGTSAQICLPDTCSGLGATTFLPAGSVISVTAHEIGSSRKTEPAEKTPIILFPAGYCYVCSCVSKGVLGTV